MADVFTETSHTGFLGNVGKSFKSVLGGIVFFVASFPILWMNEGCINLGKVAKTATTASAERIDPALDDKLVAVTGALDSTEQIGDPEYIKPGGYISLSRQVEYFEWVEDKDTDTRKNTGGSSTTTTTYKYRQQWTNTHHESSEFKHPEGHQNPKPRERDASYMVREATVGVVPFSPGDTVGLLGFTGGLPSGSRLALTPDVLTVTPSETGGDPRHPRLVGDMLYLASGTPENPTIGDARIHFDVLKPGGPVTLFGRQGGGRVSSFAVDDTMFFRVVRGDREAATQALLTEHSIMTWIFRAIGFFLMWSGMCMVFGPISAVLDVLPFLGSASRSVISFVLFPVALVLTGVTIVVSMVAHNPIVLGVVMLVIIGGGIVYLKGRGRRA